MSPFDVQLKSIGRGKNLRIKPEYEIPELAWIRLFYLPKEYVRTT